MTSISVVGTGARTPVGFNAPATAAAIRAGVSMMQEHPFMIDKQGEPMIVSLDAELSVEITGVKRLLQLALGPSLEALRPILNANRPTPPISVLVALPERRPGCPLIWKPNLTSAFVPICPDT